MRSRGSSLPRPLCLSRAACPPPCLIPVTFARRSATAARIAASFSRNPYERVSMAVLRTGITLLPAARRKPFIDLVEPIGAPEIFAVDDDHRRAEHLIGDGGVDLVTELVFH